MKVLTRRQLSLLGSALLLGGALLRGDRAWAVEQHGDDLTQRFAELEKQLDARLGVAIIDSQSGRQWRHRADERFPLCSTFKLLAGAAVLRRVDAGADSLHTRIRYTADDLVTYSPVTERHVDDGMTLAALCEAAITLSDNTAGNLLLRHLGGPGAIGAFARTLGDHHTRLDRWETELNEARPGDPRDTTTPATMAANLQRLVLGDSLSAASRDQLIAWMLASQTGAAKLRAGLPPTWRIGDKTGSGERGTTNEIAVIWPPQRKPVIACVYLTQTQASAEERNAALAAIGRALAEALTA
ncbi:class A beta-lactamase [Stutzerimonas stutzeri]|uniref:class A beta-lactamase n=1 Tax=Stutzerimonas sp. S1 TaxID=3030652 RepID=UPI002224A633|nr:class A beta-lactamase [Stutzerimonas sp. S1]